MILNYFNQRMPQQHEGKVAEMQNQVHMIAVCRFSGAAEGQVNNIVATPGTCTCTPRSPQSREHWPGRGRLSLEYYYLTSSELWDNSTSADWINKDVIHSKESPFLVPLCGYFYMFFIPNFNWIMRIKSEFILHTLLSHEMYIWLMLTGWGADMLK